MRDDYAARDTHESIEQQQQQYDTTRPAAHSLANLTPYLGLRSRLSQIWINRWTILLLLVLVRVLLAISSLNHELASAKSKALSACTGVEQAGSALASMPHYLSAGVNDLTASGVEKAVNGLMSMLMLTITGVEEIVVFYVNLLTSTYVCLITLAVGGSLHAAVAVAEDVTNFLNKTLGNIGNDIANDANSFNNDINKFIGGLNSIPEIFGKKGSIPQVNLTGDLDSLRGIHLPDDIDQGLNKLNASIPTFADVNNATNTALRFPFEEVKKLINEHVGNFTVDRSLFPVPAKEQLSFCSSGSGIDKFFGELGHIASIAAKTFVVVLIIAAILACIPMAYRDVRGYRLQQKTAVLVGQHSEDPMDTVYIASRPYTSAAGLKAAGLFHTEKQQQLARWFVAYITTVPALFILSLALAGLFSCLCQYIVLQSIKKEVPALADEVGDFAQKVVTTLQNASESWATGTNDVILKTNNDINDNVFGWVNVTTSAVNNTLNEFVDGMTDALNKTFGGTILYDPILGVFNCLIGLKIQGIEKGLTWVHDNAHIDFPTLNNSTFSLGAAASLASNGSSDNFLAAPGKTTSDDITTAITDVTDFLEQGIRQEAIISTCVLLLWLGLVIIGLVRVAIMASARYKNRGEGGPSYAGDIPMSKIPGLSFTRATPQNNNNNNAFAEHEPSPAYEPNYEPPLTTATQTQTRNPYSAFQAPMRNNSGSSETRDFSGETNVASLDSWREDEKRATRHGFAGQTGGATPERPAHQHTSSYGEIGKF